jgi:hypothetical protein
LVKFEVLRMVNVCIMAFWVVTPSGLVQVAVSNELWQLPTRKHSVTTKKTGNGKVKLTERVRVCGQD